MFKEIANKVVEAATKGRFGVEINPEFVGTMLEIEKSKRDFATRMYDRGTLIIIDDENDRVITKFVISRND